MVSENLKECVTLTHNILRGIKDTESFKKATTVSKRVVPWLIS